MGTADLLRPAVGSQFLGRDGVLARIDQGATGILLIGEDRAGKTSLLQHLRDSHPLHGWDGRFLRPIYIDLADQSVSEPAGFFRYLVRRLKTEASALGWNTTAPDEATASTAGEVMRFVHGVAADGVPLGVVLLVDNLDKPRVDLERRFIFRGLRHFLENWEGNGLLRLVCASGVSFLSSEQETPSSLVSALEKVLLHPLDRQRCEALVHVLLLDHGAGSADADVLELLWRETGGHPYLVRSVLTSALAEVPRKSLREALAAAIRSIQEREEALFEQWAHGLSLRELTFLEALAIGLHPDEATLKADTTLRFVASGFASQGGDGRLRPTCGAFFKWISSIAGTLVYPSKSRLSLVGGPESVASLLQSTLSDIVRIAQVHSEGDLQSAVATVLAAHGIQFAREVETPAFGGKKHRVDFVLPSMDLALELKFVPNPARASRAVDELIADVAAYTRFYSSVVPVLVGKVAATLLQHISDSAASAGRVFPVVVKV